MGVKDMKDPNDKKTQDMLKEPPKSNAERQKAYREKRKSLDSQRLEVFIDKSVSDMLADMVGAAGESQKAILTALIEKEYKRLYAVKNSKLKSTLIQKVMQIKKKPSIYEGFLQLLISMKIGAYHFL
jgi:hypothetical protein